MMKKLLLICSLLASYPTFAQKHYSILITHANIVDVAGGKVLPNKLIAISGDMIKAVDDTKNSAKYKADRIINANNKYVMPGLWDMHIHLRGGNDMITANKNLLPLFLAYGVTTVRECGGDITPSILQWRKQIAAGTVDGPRIFTSGPKLDGPRPTWAGSLVIQTPEQVSKALDSLQRIPSDFVKIYESKISRDAYLEAVSQAHARGLKSTGHMPYTVKLTEAVDRGMNGSEHLYYVFKACSAKEDSITKVELETEHTARPLGLFGALPALYASYDEAKAQTLFSYLAQHHFSITPTLFVSKTLAEIKETDHTQDSLLAYIDPKIQATYQGRVTSAKRSSAANTEFTKKFEAKAAAMVPQLYKAGVNILAGSDCGAFNSFVYPGSSIHEEIKLLVASGLTPREALTASIINGPKFFDLGNVYGSLQVNKSADMIMLDSDPLQNINAIDHINGVVSHGKMYNKQALAGLMASIRH